MEERRREGGKEVWCLIKCQENQDVYTYLR